MPVTAKLSRQFYDKFGDEVVNELVNWLNAVDTSYRTEFRELFEAHFGRLSAQMDRSEAELRGEFRAALERESAALRAEFRGSQSGIREILARHDARFDTIEAHFGIVDGRFGTVEAKLGHALARVENRLMKWMITFFVATAIQLTLLSAALWRVW